MVIVIVFQGKDRFYLPILDLFCLYAFIEPKYKQVLLYLLLLRVRSRQCLVGSLAGAAASQKVTEAYIKVS